MSEVPLHPKPLDQDQIAFVKPLIFAVVLAGIQRLVVQIKAIKQTICALSGPVAVPLKLRMG